MRNERKTSYESIDVIASFVFGILLCLPVYVFVFKRELVDIARGAEFAAIAAVGGGIVTVLLLLSLRVVIKRVFGKETPSAANIYKDITASANATREGDYTRAKLHADHAITGGLGLYTWVSGRQWLTSIFLGSIALFAGAASTYILYQQNRLVQEQTKILKRQENVLILQSEYMRDSVLNQDALRYVPLYSQLTDVINEIVSESKVRDNLAAYHLVPLTSELSAKVVTLTRSFRPYWYYDSFSRYTRETEQEISSENDSKGVDKINSPPMVFLSPERGMLLRAMLENKVELSDPGAGNFQYADMRGVTLLGVNGKGESAPGYVTMGSCAESESSYQHIKGIGEPDESIAAMYKVRLSKYNIDYADFSHSLFNGVLIHDDNGTLKFSNTSFINSNIYAPKGVNLSGAMVFTLTLYAATSASPMHLIARDTIFFRDFCFPSGELEEEFYEQNFGEARGVEKGRIIRTSHGLYMVNEDDFSGSLIPKNRSPDGFLAMFAVEEGNIALKNNPLSGGAGSLALKLRCFHLVSSNGPRAKKNDTHFTVERHRCI